MDLSNDRLAELLGHAKARGWKGFDDLSEHSLAAMRIAVRHTRGLGRKTGQSIGTFVRDTEVRAHFLAENNECPELDDVQRFDRAWLEELAAVFSSRFKKAAVLYFHQNLGHREILDKAAAEVEKHMRPLTTSHLHGYSAAPSKVGQLGSGAAALFFVYVTPEAVPGDAFQLLSMHKALWWVEGRELEPNALLPGFNELPILDDRQAAVALLADRFRADLILARAQA